MSAPTNDVAALMCVTSEAVACTVMASDGTGPYYVVLAEEEGYALVRADGSQHWMQVCVGDLDLDDADDLDAVVAAVIAHAFEPRGRTR